MHKRNNDSKKVLCIGLDGATFDLIEPWISENRLPNLKRIMEEGVRSNLRSVIPPVSPQAWSSFMTGVNPGKHGVFGFATQEENKYDFRFVNNSFIKVKTLWKLLGEMEKKVVVVNVPLTFPPENVNGIVISGMDTPGTAVNFTFPSHLKEEIFRIVNDYTIHLHVWGSLDKLAKRKKALDGLLKMTEKRAELCKYLIKRYPWDFFMVVFSSIDQVQHHFWKYLRDDRSFRGDNFDDAVYQVYKKNDEALGLLLECVSEDTSVVVMSDHGAGKLSGTKIHVNEILKQEKLLSIKERRQGRLGFASDLRLAMVSLVRRLEKYCTQKLSSKTKDCILRLLPGVRGKVTTLKKLSAIDWPNTKVYPGENPSVLRVNVKGRLPHGIVEAGEDYERVVGYIIAKLESLRDPETKEKLVERVFRKEEIYEGPYVPDAPDLTVWTMDNAHVVRVTTGLNNRQADIISKGLGASEVNGGHRLDGILIIKAPGVKRGRQIPTSHITDLFPTILYMMGCPVPEYVDGKVLTEIFEEKYLDANTISYVDIGMDRASSVAESLRTYDVEEEETIREHLSGLGYID